MNPVACLLLLILNLPLLSACSTCREGLGWLAAPVAAPMVAAGLLLNAEQESRMERLRQRNAENVRIYNAGIRAGQ